MASPRLRLAYALRSFRIGVRAMLLEPPSHPSVAQLIVVPGAAVRPDGTPSDALHRRISRASSLWHDGVAPTVVISGGVVTHPPAEAIAGAMLAESMGVPGSAVVRETEARNTVENARNTARLADAHHVVIVTDDSHTARAHYAFSLYFDQVSVAPCRSPYRWRRFPRETIALFHMALRGR